MIKQNTNMQIKKFHFFKFGLKVCWKKQNNEKHELQSLFS